MSDGKADLLNGSCITNGIDAVVGALHSQELVCDDGPEVRLTSLWQPLLQLQQLGHIKMQTRAAPATVMMFRKVLQTSLRSVLLPVQQVEFTRLAQAARSTARLAMLAVYSCIIKINRCVRLSCDCLRMSMYIRMASMMCKA